MIVLGLESVAQGFTVMAVLASLACAVGLLVPLFKSPRLVTDDVDPDATGRRLTLLSLAAFAMGFGWGGGVASGAGWHLTTSLALATVSGVLAVWLVGLLSRSLRMLRRSGTAR